MSYLKRHGTRRVPQWAPLPGQAPNSAGGSPSRMWRNRDTHRPQKPAVERP